MFSGFFNGGSRLRVISLIRDVAFVVLMALFFKHRLLQPSHADPHVKKTLHFARTSDKCHPEPPENSVKLTNVLAVGPASRRSYASNRRSPGTTIS